MNNKKKYLSIIISFNALDRFLYNQDYLIKKLSKNFDKIFIINSENLKFFSKKKDYKISTEVKKFPNNFILFDPKDSKDLSKFLEDKTILVINYFGRQFPELKIHLLLKKYKIQQLLITNYGHVTTSQITQFKHFFKLLSYYSNNIFAKKFTNLLSILGIISKIEIQFLSAKVIMESFQNDFFKRLFYKYKFTFAKEYILVNSKTYDILIDSKIPLGEDYIVHIDASLNYYHETELRGKLDKETIRNHYYYLEKILKRLSQEFNKEVLVCIHPAYDTEEHQNYFKDFKVLKFKTRENIYKSFLVTTFDSTAIVDAILLKKKIIGFISDVMSKNEIEHTKSFADRGGYLKLNTQKDYLFDKEKILFQMNKNLSNYDKYILNHHCFEPNNLGIDKIIRIIKERFFNV